MDLNFDRIINLSMRCFCIREGKCKQFINGGWTNYLNNNILYKNKINIKPNK